MPSILLRWPGVHVAPLALIALVCAASCGGGTSRPRPTEPPDIGAYEDRFDFRGFGEKLDGAVDGGDLSFFTDNVALEAVRCEESLPAPPRSCAGQPAGTVVPAVLLSVWESEDRYLDREGYRAFMQEFLREYAEGESDSYGDARPRLYAYAVIDPEIRSSPAGSDAVESILTRIAPTPAGPEREALLITATFDGRRWNLSRLTSGPAVFLDPYGPQATADGADGVFEFWRRWQD